MTLNDSTRTMLNWLREATAPAPDPLDASCPLRVLERNRLSDAEAQGVAAALRAVRRVTAVDVGVEITKVLDVLPHPEDIRTVLELIAA